MNRNRYCWAEAPFDVVWNPRQKDKKRLTSIKINFFQKNSETHTVWLQKGWRNFGRVESRISWKETKKTQIKLTATCNKNGQQQDDKKYAELQTKCTKETWKASKETIRRRRYRSVKAKIVTYYDDDDDDEERKFHGVHSLHCKWFTNPYSSNKSTVPLLRVSLLITSCMLRLNCHQQGATTAM